MLIKMYMGIYIIYSYCQTKKENKFAGLV